MSKYRIAWLPGDGVGPEVCDAARLVLDAAGFQAEYLHGDIGWEFWRREGDEAAGYRFHALVTLTELLDELGHTGHLSAEKRHEIDTWLTAQKNK